MKTWTVSIAAASLVAMAALSNVAGAQAGTPTGSQVGFYPSSSPFRDLEYSQELTFLGGQFHAHRDPAGVAPQGGATVGVHYEWRAAGPTHLVAEFSRISSVRDLITPFRSGNARFLGTESRPLYALDADLGVSLTGSKSWHRFVPELYAGAGVISDLKVAPDTGGFRFGTRFAFNFGAGVRYLLGGPWQIRADLKDRFYTIGYPESYYLVPTNGTAVLTPDQPKSIWLNNPALTLGLSYLF